MGYLDLLLAVRRVSDYDFWCITCLHLGRSRESFCHLPTDISLSLRLRLVVSLKQSLGQAMPGDPSTSWEYSTCFGILLLLNLLM